MPLDPVLQQLFAQVPSLPDGPIDYPAARAMAASFIPMLAPPESLAPVGSVEEQHLPSTSGSVPIRVYRPVGAAAGIVHYIHGGGWCIGDLATVDHTARRLCDGLSMVVVASSYRLAPEHPFPAAFDDSILAARWVLAHRAELVEGATPTILAGDSAGGNVAAAIALTLRDKGEPTFDAQLLLYPAVDLRADAMTYRSRQRNEDPALNVGQMASYISDYVGGADVDDQRISPLAADCVADLPPTLIVVLTVDPLHDEAIAYADRLRDARVKVEVLEFANMTHGFVNLSAIVPAAATATTQVMEKLQTMVAGPA